MASKLKLLTLNDWRQVLILNGSQFTGKFKQCDSFQSALVLDFWLNLAALFTKCYHSKQLICQSWIHFLILPISIWWVQPKINQLRLHLRPWTGCIILHVHVKANIFEFQFPFVNPRTGKFFCTIERLKCATLGKQIKIWTIYMHFLTVIPPV